MCTPGVLFDPARRKTACHDRPIGGKNILDSNSHRDALAAGAFDAGTAGIGDAQTRAKFNTNSTNRSFSNAVSRPRPSRQKSTHPCPWPQYKVVLQR